MGVSATTAPDTPGFQELATPDAASNAARPRLGRPFTDLKKPPMSREFVLATVVKLLEKTLIRIGNQEYARANGSFGLTTLRDEHVDVKGASMRFHFRAKSGVMIRDTTAANSSYVFVFVTPSNGVNMQYRNGTGTSAVQLAQIAGPGE